MINTVEIKYSCAGRYPEILINGEIISRYMSLADYIYDDIFRWADQFFSIIDDELAEDYNVVLTGHSFHKFVLDCFINKSEFCKGIEFNQLESKIPLKDKYDFTCELNQKYSIIPNFVSKSLKISCSDLERFGALFDNDGILTTDSSDYALYFEGDDIALQSNVNIFVSESSRIEKTKNSTSIYITKEALPTLLDYLNSYHIYLPVIEDTFSKLPNISLDVASKLEFEAFSKEEYRFIFNDLPGIVESGESVEISYDYFPKCFEKPAIKVFVDNPAVLSYQNGVLVANDKGVCDVRVCDNFGNEHISKTIEVNKHNFATNITVVLPSTSMHMGETMSFRCIVTPNDAEDVNDLRFSVNNEKIAVISGKNEIYAIAPGRVCVTASTQRVSKNFYIDVLSHVNGIAVSAEEVEVPCSAEATIYCAPIPYNASPAPVLSWSAKPNPIFKIIKADSRKCTISTLNHGQAELLCKINGSNIVKKVKIVVPKPKGCYVATSVYGSYDCPEVWVLRRFRDNYLENYTLGRLFIKLYYAVSPTIVEIFGKYNWFNKLCKAPLNSFVMRLRKNGYEDTPYKDGK